MPTVKGNKKKLFSIIFVITVLAALTTAITSHFFGNTAFVKAIEKNRPRALRSPIP
jgi:hypothetical protein